VLDAVALLVSLYVLQSLCWVAAAPNEYFEQTYEILSAVKSDEKVALIHCTTGKNISPTLVLAHMMISAKKQDKHLPLAKAIQFIQAKAPGANPSEQFMALLVDLEVELFEGQ